MTKLPSLSGVGAAVSGRSRQERRAGGARAALPVAGGVLRRRVPSRGEKQHDAANNRKSPH